MRILNFLIARLFNCTSLHTFLQCVIKKTNNNSILWRNILRSIYLVLITPLQRFSGRRTRIVSFNRRKTAKYSVIIQPLSGLNQVWNAVTSSKKKKKFINLTNLFLTKTIYIKKKTVRLWSSCFFVFLFFFLTVLSFNDGFYRDSVNRSRVQKVKMIFYEKKKYVYLWSGLSGRNKLVTDSGERLENYDYLSADDLFAINTNR